jgi:glycine C-acetyltransferase
MQLVIGALKRLELIKTKPEIKQKLWDNVNELQSGLKEKGFDLGSTQSCVTPVYLNGTVPEAFALVKDLRENYGVFCSTVIYPVIPKGLILLRLIPTASHNSEDIQVTLKAFSSIRERLLSGVYKKLSEDLPTMD